MTTPVILLKHGIYGDAVQVTPTAFSPAHWLLTMKWPSEAPRSLWAEGPPAQYHLTTQTLAAVVDGDGPNWETVVHLLDHSDHDGPFTALEVYEGTITMFATPTVVIQYQATALEARALTRSLVGACLEGILHPGVPKASDWQSRSTWVTVSKALLELIKEAL